VSDRRKLTSPINGLKGGTPKSGVRRGPQPPHLATRLRAAIIQEHAELDAVTVIEQMARGALFNPKGLYYDHDGVERYAADGPLDSFGNPSWRKGDVKREWSVGDLKPLHELTEAQAQCIAGVEVVMKNAVAGDGKIDRVLKYRFVSREKFVEMAARYHSLLVDRVDATLQVQGVGQKLDQARLRAAQAAKARKA